jgi:hypothetical protein
MAFGPGLPFAQHAGPFPGRHSKLKPFRRGPGICHEISWSGHCRHIGSERDNERVFVFGAVTGPMIYTAVTLGAAIPALIYVLTRAS